MPWSALCGLIEPVYPKPGNGRPPVGVERMLRIYFLQHWFNLSDPAVEEALYDSQASPAAHSSLARARLDFLTCRTGRTSINFRLLYQLIKAADVRSTRRLRRAQNRH